MRKRISVLIFVLAAFVLTTSEVFAQEQENEVKPKFGIGVNGGVQQIYCDIPVTGLAIAGEGFMRFLLSDRFNLQLGLGYGQLSDGLSKRSFATTVLNGDLKGNVYLLKSGVFRPFGTLGFGAINYTVNNETNVRIDPALDGKGFWDVAFIVGGGVDLMLSDKIALTATGDYRFTTTDGLDGIEGGTSKDGYVNLRAGLAFYVGKRAPRVKEELLVDQTTVQVDEEMPEEKPMPVYAEDDETADILALLMGTAPEEDTTKTEKPTEPTVKEQTVEEVPVGDPKQRIEDLKVKIQNKEDEIALMEQDISTKDARIIELEKELEQVEKLSGDFRSNYKEALRLYSARQPDKSIALFKSLFAAYPEHKLASNCTYWLGENYFMKGQYNAAIKAFNAVFVYPNSYKLDDATLMMGRCYQKLGQREQAISWFEKVVSDYPDSEYVPKAQEWLSRIQ